MNKASIVKFPRISAIEPHCLWVNIGSGNGLVSGNDHALLDFEHIFYYNTIQGIRSHRVDKVDHQTGLFLNKIGT